MTGPERQAALDRARAGDAEARGRLLEGYRPYVRVLVRGCDAGRLKARLDGSDLIQDALLEAHRAFADFRGATAAELTAWVRQIALRTARRTLRSHLDAARRSAGRERPADDLAARADDAETPAEAAMRHEQAARVAEALARLPDDMQRVLLGRHADGLSYADLAERLGRTEGAVRVLYTRALRRLREEQQAAEARPADETTP